MKTLAIGVFVATLLSAMTLAQDAAPSQTNTSPTANPPETTVPPPQQNPATTQNPAAAQNPAGQSSAAQPSAAAQSAQPSNGLHISPGSVIPVQLTTTIDAKKAKSGDAVEAKVTQDMKTQSGLLVVPKDTKVLGHVTEAKPRGKDQPESQVAIAFDHAEVKDKGDVALPLSIQAIIAPPNSNSNNAAAENAAETPSPGNSGGASASNGRSGVSGESQQQRPTPTPPTGNAPAGGQQTSSARPPITAQTQGIVGISDLTLAPAANSTQGSLVSSEKNNVKLESGTFMLLRVSQ